MKYFPRRKAIAITCLAGAIAIGCAVFVWPEVHAWWVKRQLVVRLTEDWGAWNKWREAEPNQVIDLCGVNLSGKDFYPSMETRGINLEEAILQGADLSDADLFFANLCSADLSGANLSRTDLIGAKLIDADLRGANFTGANLGIANFNGANLTGANLRWANLSGSDLTGMEYWENITDLTLANIYGVKNPPNGFIDFAIEKGAVEFENFYQWKKLLDVAKEKPNK